MFTSFEASTHSLKKLSDIFLRINMSELPAMSTHVQELIRLSGSGRATAADLSEIILKDYALTNKVLQVVNSAFYSLSTPVNVVSRAVTVLGFQTIRDIALSIAIFENFVKAGLEKEAIARLLARSFLSATLARELAQAEKVRGASEEAFVCALLHNLGKIVLCVYLPAEYRQVKELIGGGMAEDSAATQVLDGLTFVEVGQEIGRFWNLGDQVLSAMAWPVSHTFQDAELRTSVNDELQVLSFLVNRIVEHICLGRDFDQLMAAYESVVCLEQAEVLEVLAQNMDQATSVSKIISYGVERLEIRSRLKMMQRRGLRANITKRQQRSTPLPGTEGVAGRNDERCGDAWRQNCPRYINLAKEAIAGAMPLPTIFKIIMTGIHKGLGFDRVVLASVRNCASGKALTVKAGVGETDQTALAYFNLDLTKPQKGISSALNRCQEIIVSPEQGNVLPDRLLPLTEGRFVMLLPLCREGTAVALLYLDRRAELPPLDLEQVSAIQTFRDLAHLALEQKANSTSRSN